MNQLSPAYTSIGKVLQCAIQYKIGLINCLLNRIWRICTIQEHKDEEVAKLKLILAKNEFPDDIINSTIDKYVYLNI
jgi:hypothetical protein